jgi:hypothetical protein
MKIFLAGEYPMEKDEGWSREVSGWQTGALSKIIKRRLFSYFHHGFKIDNRLSKEIKLAFDCGMDLFLDSGAYSAYTQKETIDLQQYAEFIHTHGDMFSAVANLDDIGDTGPKSWANLKELEILGCDVLPVFHYNDDVKYLNMMLDNYPSIALGGLVGSSRKVLQEWLDRIWLRLIDKEGTPRLRVHGFGLTDYRLMARYPWHSLDSASWARAGMYGGCVFHENGRLYHISFSDESPVEGWHYKRLTDKQREKIDKWLEPHKVTAAQCASHYSFRHLVNAATYQNMESIGSRHAQARARL